MMYTKKLYRVFIFIALLLPSIGAAEVITNFESQMQINTDGSINIVENINYDPQGNSRQGIYRTIPLDKTSISNISVLRDNFSEVYNISRGLDDITIRIGQEGAWFSTSKLYQLRYTLNNAAVSGRNNTTFFHHITGSDWKLDILQASAIIRFPQSIMDNEIQALECGIVLGLMRTNNQCSITRIDDMTLRISADTRLSPGEGLSFILKLPVGIIDSPKVSPYISSQDITIASYIIGGGISILFLIWWFWGRSPILKKPIVRQYDPPKGISPAAVGYLRHNKTSPKLVSATIVSLAQKRIISVKQSISKKFWDKAKYSFDLVDEEKAKTTPYMVEFLLLESIFRGYFISSDPYFRALKAHIVHNDYLSWKKMVSAVIIFVIGVWLVFGELWGWILAGIYGATVRLREIQDGDKFNEMYQAIYIEEIARYYNKVPQAIKILLALIAISAASTLFISYLLGYIFIPFSCIIIVVLTVVTIKKVPRRNQAGNEMLEYILGLEEYIVTAEKERLDFYGKEHVFFELLPYAIALGHEKNWAKVFEGIIITGPEWLSDSIKFHDGAFTYMFVQYFVPNIPISVNRSIINMSLSTDATGVFVQGASSGGGFGGFGSGGGGGGSW